MKRLRVWLILACLCTSCMGLIDFDYYWQADLGRYELLFGDFNRCYSQVWGVTSGTYLDHEWLCNIFFYVFSGFGEYSVLITKMVMALIIGAGIVFVLRGVFVERHAGIAGTGSGTDVLTGIFQGKGIQLQRTVLTIGVTGSA